MAAAITKVTDGCSEMTCFVLEELGGLVWWGDATDCPYKTESKALQASVDRRKKTYSYGAVLLSSEDECIVQIVTHIIDEIGFLSKSFQRYERRNDLFPCCMKEETGSGEHQIVACVHPYRFPIGGKKGMPLAGFFFDEPIRALVLSIFCKYAVYHPWVLHSLLPFDLSEPHVVHISEYAREL